MNQHNSILLQAQRLGVSPKPPPIIPVTLYGDEIDQRVSTLVILIPGRAHIVGHLIGKGGAEVGRIEKDMSVTIKIESANKVAVVDRSVCILGSVASITLAQQHVSHKVHEKLLSESVQAEVLKMVVPNEIVRHLIGKNGANINRLQSESGARIQVEPESTMSPGSIGRTIVLQGAERCRTFAQYLILRQIAEDRNVPADWASRIHTPTNSVAAAPYNMSPTPQSPAITGGVGNQMMTYGSPQQSSMTMLRNAADESEVVTMNVPEAAVAFLIGRGGSSVMDIQNQTGAHIHIARSQQHLNGGLHNPDELRRVTITGPYRSVEAAQNLIRSRVQMALTVNSAAHPPVSSPTSTMNFAADHRHF
jgi:predicted PilT family ATPase